MFGINNGPMQDVNNQLQGLQFGRPNTYSVLEFKDSMESSKSDIKQKVKSDESSEDWISSDIGSKDVQKQSSRSSNPSLLEDFEIDENASRVIDISDDDDMEVGDEHEGGYGHNEYLR